MSHIATIKIAITDLDALKKAVKAMGLEFVEGQQTYKWYGRSVGDYPLPEGFKTEDLGKCEHAIRIPGNDKAYEIGVARARNGQKGYTLLWDFWNKGYGMQDKVGKDGGLLIQEYSGQVTRKHLIREGFRVNVTTKEDGTRVYTGVRA